jgi:hypothetical protein
MLYRVIKLTSPAGIETYQPQLRILFFWINLKNSLYPSSNYDIQSARFICSMHYESLIYKIESKLRSLNIIKTLGNVSDVSGLRRYRIVEQDGLYVPQVRRFFKWRNLPHHWVFMPESYTQSTAMWYLWRYYNHRRVQIMLKNFIKFKGTYSHKDFPSP